MKILGIEDVQLAIHMAMGLASYLHEQHFGHSYSIMHNNDILAALMRHPEAEELLRCSRDIGNVIFIIEDILRDAHTAIEENYRVYIDGEKAHGKREPND